MSTPDGSISQIGGGSKMVTLRRLREGTRAEWGAALEAWPHDAEVVGVAASGLMRLASRRPRDEPPLEPGPAELAVEALDALGESLDEGETLSVALLVLRACALGRVAVDRDAEAQRAFEVASRAAPADADLAIEQARFHAWRGRFEQALTAARRAHDLSPESRQAAALRATIATALGQGAEAVAAWRAMGLPARLREASGMPEVEGLPAALVRVPARGGASLGADAVPERAAAFELLSVAPLSPAHGVIQSASLLDAVVDYGDVVLWEPIPVALSEQVGEPSPCFPLLEILRRGDELRLRILVVSRPGEGPLAPRVRRGLGARAKLATHVERRADSGEALLLGKLLAPGDADLEALMETLETLRQAEDLALACPALYDRGSDSARAGKEHKTWLALERRAERLGLASRTREPSA